MNRRVANGRESNGLIRIFTNKENCEKGLGHPFITSSCVARGGAGGL